MNLEQQLTSLELSKKLKELGVKQESLFHWTNTDRNEPSLYATTGIDDCIFGYTTLKAEGVAGNPYWFPKEELDEEDWYSAFTVAELGEMLSTKENNNTIRCTMTYTMWVCDYEAYRTSGDTEADARANMLIFLLENNLIEL